MIPFFFFGHYQNDGRTAPVISSCDSTWTPTAASPSSCSLPCSGLLASSPPATSSKSSGNGTVEFDEPVNAILPDMNEEILINQEQLIEVFQSFERKRMRE
ncbi:hypothetical protein CerSpe_188370 [Prunus speciosa]